MATGLEFDYFVTGLLKINIPLLTPLKLSLEEWSTRPAKDGYEFFVVVMHNGIAISSGYYTGSVKVITISGLELDKENLVAHQVCEIGKATTKQGESKGCR